MKKHFYIGLVMLLGWLISFLIHAGIEIPTLALVTGEAGNYGDNIIWQNWNIIHRAAGMTLSFGGIVLGFFLGRRFWQILYVEKRYGTPRW